MTSLHSASVPPETSKTGKERNNPPKQPRNTERAQKTKKRTGDDMDKGRGISEDRMAVVRSKGGGEV